MKKILSLLILLFVLVSCSDKSAQSLIEDQINSIAEIEIKYENNNYKKLYDYFTNVDVGKIDSNEVSSLLSVDKNVFVMNLKVNKIINDEIYKNDNLEYYDIKQLKFENNGLYLSNGIKYNYEYNVYLLNNDDYLLLMNTEYLNFSTIAQLTQLDEIAYEMINVAKSVRIDNQLIVNEFSNKETLDHEKETIKLFEKKIAVNGTLEEMMGIDTTEDFMTNEDENFGEINTATEDNENITKEEGE
jgi:hypothetical protein